MTALSNAISELSSGPIYYESVQGWYEKLKLTLQAFNLEAGPLLKHATKEGNGHVHIPDAKKAVYFTWYHMEHSGRWEIICYLVPWR